MKTTAHLSLKHLALALLFSPAATIFASSDTANVYVPAQPSFSNGAWVNVPGHDAQAPLPKDHWTGYYEFANTSGYYKYPQRKSVGPQVVAGVRIVKATSFIDPVSHASTRTITTVDKNGTLVSRVTTQSSAPVKIYSTQNGVKMEADKVTIKTTTTTTI